MPRTRREAPVVIPTNSLVASAVRFPGKSARVYNPTGDWQRECYRHYMICGEAAFAANFYGHALSRACLGVGQISTDPEGEYVQTGTPNARAYLDELCHGADGQEQMLSSIGVHLAVAGECYLVGRKVQPDENRTDKETVWEIVSVLEMHVTGRRWTIKYGDNQQDIALDDDDVVIRIWLPNPAKRIEAYSPFRPLLPILTEIEYLTKHIFAQVQSRLAGAGVWPLPQGTTFPAPPEVDGKPADYANETDGFMLTLGNSMLTPLSDPSSPAALVPIIISVPDDQLQNIKGPIHFWSPLDENAGTMRKEAISRFAVGMDLPPEQVLGMSSNSGTGGGNSNGVSHWGAWQIEESTIKLHIEPMLGVVVNALTIGYLRPLTEDAADLITYDTSKLRLRPDRSQESIEMYDRGAVSLTVMLNENGFTAEDAPTPEELTQWLLTKVAAGSATPEMVNAALAALGVDLGIVVDSSAVPNEARPDPSLEDHPNRPATPEYATLVAACDGLVYRALERAGNRLRQNGSKPPDLPSYETHTLIDAKGKEAMLLTDAWPCAAKVLDGVADIKPVVAVLNAYVTHLLATGTKHDRDEMTNWLTRIPLGRIA